MPYCIMTFDGGGICGLFTARLVERILARFPALITNTKLLAGTSTGGIIALGLANGLTPTDLVRLYRDRGKKIFDDSWWDNIRDLGTAVGADYSNSGLKKILKEVMGAETRLSGLSKRVLVPAFDLDSHDEDDQANRTWKPKFFHNFPGNDTDGQELVVDVCLRTSAAPTFFPAYQGYIDGGVVANNPSLAAIATALDSRAGKQKLDDIILLSFSTGTDRKHIKGESLDWGWGQWARPLVAIMISGVMGVAHFQCKQLLGDSYRRVDRVFDRTVSLDDVKPGSLDYLIAQADMVSLDPLIAWLQQRWM